MKKDDSSMNGPEQHEFIPYGRQWIDEDDIQAVVEALKSDYLTTGPRINEFEEQLADYVGAKFAVAVSNGTAALHSACFAAGIGSGDEVITSPITFAASANCVLYMGAKPVFADIDPVTYNIDPADIRRKITPRTKAIIPVHYAGQPCDMDAIMQIADEHGLTVIEDGAHALGAEYKGRRIGGMGNLTTFSFHPVKHITTGEGGAIATNDKKTFEKLSLFRSHGITRDERIMTCAGGPWYYEQQLLGYNYRMTDVQAVLGMSQLKKLEMFITKRREYVKKYGLALGDLESLILPHQLHGADSSWHLYVVRLKLDRLSATRKEIFIDLRRMNIGVNVHYIPVYHHPYYRSLGYAEGICPNAEGFYESALTLPLYPKMTESEADYVIESLTELLKKYGG